MISSFTALASGKKVVAMLSGRKEKKRPLRPILKPLTSELWQEEDNEDQERPFTRMQSSRNVTFNDVHTVHLFDR